MTPCKQLCLLFVLLSLSLLHTGCTVTYPVVGYSYHYNEVAKGTIRHNTLSGTATIGLKLQVSGIEGTGHTWVTYIPPMGTIKGQRGKAIINFDDGRTVEADWFAESLTKGHGTGHDQDGNRFAFRYGMNDTEADSFVRKQLAIAQSKPSLPTYSPKETRREKGYSTGTGFFISDRGYILTNYHVVEDAREITVVDYRGNEYGAVFVRGNRDHDLAVIRVDGATSQALRLVPADDIQRGQEVFTLGYPLIQLQGQEQKATFGRVNALSGVRGDPRYLQVDVPVQPGNSGGPLIDLSGSVIGVVTATLDQWTTLVESGMLPQNVNYAVKADYAIGLCNDLMQSMNDGNMEETRSSIAEIINEIEPSIVLIVTK